MTVVSELQAWMQSHVRPRHWECRPEDIMSRGARSRLCVSAAVRLSVSCLSLIKIEIALSVFHQEQQGVLALVAEVSCWTGFITSSNESEGNAGDLRGLRALLC